MSRVLLIALTIAMLAVSAGSVLAPQAAHAGGGCHEPSTDARRTTVDLKELCIIPTVLRVDVGETVTWVNRDSTPHTVTSAGIRSGDGRGWGSMDELVQGQAYTHVFDHAGVYPYFCYLHPGMVGTVVAGDGNVAAYPSETGGALPDTVARLPGDATPASATSSSVVARPMLVALSVAAALVLAGAMALRHRARQTRSSSDRQ